MKTLYKKDSKGKIREWTICTIDDELIQKSGIVDGKLVEHNKLCKSKNVGKSNSTTGSEQAILEMESLIKSKFSEGYFKTKDEAENEVVILPMLASDYNKFSKKIDWNNCYVQPKLDGMRCLAIIENGQVTLKSRDGKIIENMDHITEALKMVEHDCILDGELYCHGNSFQENMKLIKKYRKGETEKVHYHVYDIDSDHEFRERTKEVFMHLHDLNNEYIDDVDTNEVKSMEDVNKYHKEFLSQGYEGSIIRHGDKPYELDKRSTSLLKYKDFQDIDAEIIDITPNDSNPLHGTPLLKYSVNKPSGVSISVFKAGVKMSHEERVDLLANKHLYIGKLANIRFFEWTDDICPRFPVMIGIHLDR